MLFLPTERQGPEQTEGLDGGKAQRVLLSMPTTKKIAGVPNVYRRAVIVERAACAIGNVFNISDFVLCMYSTDTLHPSP